MVGGYHRQKPSKSAGHLEKQEACRTCFETPPPTAEEKYAGGKVPFNYPKKINWIGSLHFHNN
jgi:hypothetical protein